MNAQPDYLWSIAQTQRLGGDCRDAILTYKAYLRTATTAQAGATQELIKKCEADLAAQQRAAEQAVILVPAALQVKSVQESPPVRHAWYVDGLGDGLFAGGVVIAAVGGVFLAMGSSKNAAASSASNVAGWSSDTSVASTYQIVGATGVGVGAALVAGAIWRYIVVRRHGREHTTPSAPSVSFSVGHGGTALSFGGRF